MPSLQEDLIAVRRQRQPLHDSREHADLRQVLGARVLLVARFLAERGDEVLLVGDALQQADVAIDAHLQREHAARKEDGRDERDDGQPARKFVIDPLRWRFRVFRLWHSGPSYGHANCRKCVFD